MNFRGKKQGQQGNAEQGPSKPGKGSEEKGKQDDDLSSQQGWIHGIQGPRLTNRMTSGNHLRSASVLQGKINGNYPDDKPYPSCLTYGKTFSREPVHSVWAYHQETRRAVLITLYRPDPARWLDWRTRRPK